MLSVGIFPDLLKISKVIPLYKKDDPVNLSIYRPISLLQSISKIFEKAIIKQLADYLEENNLMYKYSVRISKISFHRICCLTSARLFNYRSLCKAHSLKCVS